MMTTYARPARGRNVAASYAKVGLETQIMSASPEKIISLLLAGARANIAKARIYLSQGNVPGRTQSITKATDIVSAGLRAAVDDSVGEVAKSLIHSYDLATHHLLLSNLRASEKHMVIADQILADVESAWNEATGLLTPSTEQEV